MSGEFEAAGALATAGLAAGAIEGRGAGAPGEGGCLNCGAALAGPYCSQCGQAAHPHRSLVHLIEEALHGIIHFDTKAWRTLPMVAFRPGTLTRNYTYGKRASYISPLALFLFTIFLMFFVFAFADVNLVQVNSSGDREQVVQSLEQQRENVRELEERVAALRAQNESAASPAELDQEAEAAQRELRQGQLALRVLGSELARMDSRAAGALEDANSQETPAAEAPEGASDAPRTWQEELADAARSGDITIRTPFPELNERVLHSLQNPDLAIYKIQNTAYKFSFLLVPISLPFMWLLFLWRRGLTLYDHTVFILYSLSFASLVFVVVALANPVPWLEWTAGALLGVAMPVHMFFHLKGAYALGWWSATWRTLLLIVFATTALSLFLLSIVLLGLGG